MPYVKPRWKIEVRATTFPPYQWMELRSDTKRYVYVEKSDAEKDLATLKRIQPHAILRIAPM